jgi:hypothetical protein
MVKKIKSVPAVSVLSAQSEAHSRNAIRESRGGHQQRNLAKRA